MRILSFFKNTRREKERPSAANRSILLTRLNALEKIEFLESCHLRSHTAGEELYHIGDPSGSLYIIDHGEVELVSPIQYNMYVDQVENIASQNSNHSTNIEGNLRKVRLVAPSFFGFFSISDSVRRLSTVKCIMPSSFYVFFQSDFEMLRRRFPQIALKVLVTLYDQMIVNWQYSLNEKHTEPSTHFIGEAFK